MSDEGIEGQTGLGADTVKKSILTDNHLRLHWTQSSKTGGEDPKIFIPKDVRADYKITGKDEIYTIHPQRESFRELQERMGTKMVDMNGDGIVFADPGKRVAIATSALGGCTSLIVLAEDPTDPAKRAAIVGHYDPMAISLGQHTQHLPGYFGDLYREGLTSRGFIISPGQNDISSPTRYSPASGQYNTST